MADKRGDVVVPLESAIARQRAPYDGTVLEDLGTLADLTRGGVGPVDDITLAGSVPA